MWAEMDDNIEKSFRLFGLCQQHQSMCQSTPVYPRKVANNPWLRLYINYSEALKGKITSQKFENLLRITDILCIKSAWYHPATSTTAERMLNAFKNILTKKEGAVIYIRFIQILELPNRLQEVLHQLDPKFIERRKFNSMLVKITEDTTLNKNIFLPHVE